MFKCQYDRRPSVQNNQPKPAKAASKTASSFRRMYSAVISTSPRLFLNASWDRWRCFERVMFADEIVNAEVQGNRRFVSFQVFAVAQPLPLIPL
jgi:hypothetical protein